eukprot:TRINITY_DN8064_c0_g1_i1.p4 TRINITY_DN8064_c0_g1~~TRINITY_DN8064_c0_g1_i1.p4  ORF type:complete len:149 (+),score=22.15 TRINITY_DN8064_c0_g1_i1:2411-2857(+)
MRGLLRRHLARCCRSWIGLEACNPRSDCRRGDYASDQGSLTSDRVCQDGYTFANDTYQDVDKHRIDSCKPRVLCQPVERVQDQGDDARNRICVACTCNTWEPKQNHRDQVCQSRTLCQSGYKTSDRGDSSSDKGSSVEAGGLIMRVGS